MSKNKRTNKDKRGHEYALEAIHNAAKTITKLAQEYQYPKIEKLSKEIEGRVS